jgi:hypothetical protein
VNQAKPTAWKTSIDDLNSVEGRHSPWRLPQ